MVLSSITAALGLQGWFGGSTGPTTSSANEKGMATNSDDGPQLEAFSDAAFENVLKQMKSPDLTGFDLFADTRGVQVYRRMKGDSGLYEYKVIGVQSGVDARTCARVNVDLDYRKKWDKYVNQLHKLKEYSSGLQVIYWQVAYPFPMTNRDYFFYRRTREMTFTTEAGRQQPAWVTIGETAPADPVLCPETKALRCDEYQQTMAITGDDAGTGSRLFLHCFDNPKGSIPTWLINYFASSGVSSYLDSVKKAVQDYKD